MRVLATGEPFIPSRVIFFPSKCRVGEGKNEVHHTTHAEHGSPIVRLPPGNSRPFQFRTTGIYFLLAPHSCWPRASGTAGAARGEGPGAEPRVERALPGAVRVLGGGGKRSPRAPCAYTCGSSSGEPQVCERVHTPVCPLKLPIGGLV